MLYERARDMASRVAQASREASSYTLPHWVDLEARAVFADRVFCFYAMKMLG
jgi:hypothetical protein